MDKLIYNCIASNLAILCHKNLQKSTKSPISHAKILKKTEILTILWIFDGIKWHKMAKLDDIQL